MIVCIDWRTRCWSRNWIAVRRWRRIKIRIGHWISCRKLRKLGIKMGGIPWPNWKNRFSYCNYLVILGKLSINCKPNSRNLSVGNWLSSKAVLAPISCTKDCQPACRITFDMIWYWPLYIYYSFNRYTHTYIDRHEYENRHI